MDKGGIIFYSQVPILDINSILDGLHLGGGDHLYFHDLPSKIG